MEDNVDMYKSKVNVIYGLVKEIVAWSGQGGMIEEDRNNFFDFDMRCADLGGYALRSNVNVNEIIKRIRGVAESAKIFGLGIVGRGEYDERINSNAREILSKADNLVEAVHDMEFIGPYSFSEREDDQIESDLDENGFFVNYQKKIIEMQEKFQLKVRGFEDFIARSGREIENIKQKSADGIQEAVNEISDLRNSIDQLKYNISSLHEDALTESKKAAQVSEDAAEYSQEVHSQINELLGQTASKVLLVDYAHTADAEKTSANIMRRWALICMALAGGVLCFALYESLKSELDWRQAIFKTLAAIALSVPAAYLARESAKHRNQEHINRKISLDLRAIDPYIATLPSEERNSIKSEIASRIFGVQESGNVYSDNYPVNIQELAKLIIEKIPTRT